MSDDAGKAGGSTLHEVSKTAVAVLVAAAITAIGGIGVLGFKVDSQGKKIEDLEKRLGESESRERLWGQALPLLINRVNQLSAHFAATYEKLFPNAPPVAYPPLDSPRFYIPVPDLPDRVVVYSESDKGLVTVSLAAPFL